MNLPRLFFVCNLMAVLCFTIATPVFSQEKFNLFDRKNKRSEERIKRTETTDLERRIIQALREVGEPEEQKHSQAIWYYGFFFAGLAVIIACLVYWQIWLRKQKERVLNDPMALVQELNSVHQLSEKEKQLMKEISERQALSSSLKLFVEPKFLVESWDDELFTSSRPIVRSLLLKLFNISVENLLPETMETDAVFLSSQGTRV